MTMLSPALQIEQLGEILGVELCLDERQQVLLLIDGNHPVSLRFQAQRWRFYGMVHAVPEDKSPTYFQRLLTLNLNELDHGEGGLCLDESAQTLMYVGGPSSAIYTADELYDSLEQFVQRVDALRTVVCEP